MGTTGVVLVDLPLGLCICALLAQFVKSMRTEVGYRTGAATSCTEANIKGYWQKTKASDTTATF